MKKQLLKLFKYWLVVSVVITIIFGTVYVTAQQNLRQSANDPQIELSEDIAAALSAGAQFAKSLPIIDIAKSLSPFTVVYDPEGKPAFSTGYLNGKIPSPPTGVLASAKKSGENRITWQPENGVRIATVVNYFENASTSGYVLVGRSLREAERRVDQLTGLAAFGWLVSVLFAVIALFYLIKKRLL